MNPITQPFFRLMLALPLAGLSFSVQASPVTAQDIHRVTCDGRYRQHLQGVCVAEDALFWSFTSELVRTDLTGRLQHKVPVADHHGDLCLHNGRLYVAVNLGEFNNPAGKADSWVYVYNATDLAFVTRHPVPEVVYGAGGIGIRDNHFFVVGGLPDAITENYVYEYDEQLTFVRRHVIASGHTHLGIQTATFAHDRWWFGCYGSPQILLITDAQFQVLGRHPFDCSLGIAGLPQGRLLIASGRCDKSTGCTGTVTTALPDSAAGLKAVD